MGETGLNPDFLRDPGVRGELLALVERHEARRLAIQGPQLLRGHAFRRLAAGLPAEELVPAIHER